MLHVLLGADCNNNCVFCMEADRRARRRRIAAQSPGDVQRMLDDYSQRDEVLFTSGEPTLNPRLPEHIAAARQRGYRTIGLISNARRLAYAGYAARLLDAGLNKVTVSIHGHQARLHDGLTRSRGAFAQSLAGLDNLVALRRAGRRLDLHTSTVVVRRNLPHIAAIHALLAGRGVDRMVFNAMMAKGRGAEKIGLLMARYRDVAAAFAALAQRLDAEQRRAVCLADIPACTAAGLAFALVGEQEPFDQFETTGSSGISGVDTSALAAGRAGAAGSELARRAAGRPALRADADYYLTSRQLKDRLHRIKRPACRDCRHDARCPGVWQAYVEHFGWDEFEPLRGGKRPPADEAAGGIVEPDPWKDRHG
jgi:cyclic pyranopterin phosphate synthase